MFIFLMFVVATAQASAARRRRRMLEEEAPRGAALAQRGAGGEPPSPVAGMPFGGLCEQMLMPGAGWTRTLEYDERTGEWFEPEAQPSPGPPTAEPEPSP